MRAVTHQQGLCQQDASRMSAPVATALGLRKATQAQNGTTQTKKLVIKPLKSKRVPASGLTSLLARQTSA